jgi:hypothetical protein
MVFSDTNEEEKGGNQKSKGSTLNKMIKLD